MNYRILAITLLLTLEPSLAAAPNATAPKAPPAKSATNATLATNADRARLRQDLTKLSQSIQHLAVNFEQKTYKKLRNRTLTERGRGLFSKPNRFSWRIYESKKALAGKIKKAYYYNGAALDVYSGRENQVTEYASLGSMGQGLGGVVDMVLNPKVLLSRYTIAKVSPRRADGSYSAVLTPKQSGDIKRLELMVDMQALYIRDIKLRYQNGNTIAFAFSKPSFNPLKKTVFRFSGPKSVKRKKAS